MKNYIFCLILISFSYILPKFIELSDKNKSDLYQFAKKASSTRYTVFNTYQIAVECLKNKIEGDFIECGVARGAQVAAMAYACQNYKIYKKIHLFDSFQGIPLAGPNDTQQPGIGLIQHNINVSDLNDLLVSSNSVYQKLGHAGCFSVQEVKDNMKKWKINSKLLLYHKGWFQHTLPIIAPTIKQISFLRLDGDLYESTKVCLEYLYPKISKGGYIVIDDYGSLSGCSKAVNEYLKKHNINPEIISVPNGKGPVYWQIK